jgi:hypothetical protein
LKLRNLGVYVLPNKKRVIAAARPGGYSLYSLPAWELYGGRVPADYEVSGEGAVSTRGDAGARWSADELTFTGLEAQYPKAAGPV